MSKNSRTDHFFIYGKKEDGSHNGITYCVLLRNGRMYHGEARCSHTDQFEKAIGRPLAFERAFAEYERDAKCRGETVEEYNNPYLRKLEE